MAFANLVGDLRGRAAGGCLAQTGEVVVERDVRLPGRSGAPRQIDVLHRAILSMGRYVKP